MTETTATPPQAAESVPERYRRLAAEMTRTVHAVPADRWDSPSPCEKWTALGLARSRPGRDAGGLLAAAEQAVRRDAEDRQPSPAPAR